jgi:hypothetical protein
VVILGTLDSLPMHTLASPGYSASEHGAAHTFDVGSWYLLHEGGDLRHTLPEACVGLLPSLQTSPTHNEEAEDASV